MPGSLTMNTVGDGFGGLVVRQTVIIFSSRLVGKLDQVNVITGRIRGGNAYMLETVPLGTALGVDVDFIVHAFETKRRIQINRGLFELLSVEARKLDIFQGPVQLNMLASNDFLARGLNDRRSEKV